MALGCPWTSQCGITRYVMCLKLWCIDTLNRLTPQTMDTYFQYLKFVPPEWLSELLEIGPKEIRHYWNSRRASGISNHAARSLKSLLHFLCTAGIGDWTGDWTDLLSQLPSPSRDEYASVRLGGAILEAAEESAIVAAIDDLVTLLRNKGSDPRHTSIVEICILICSFQFGLRPKQIALLELGQIRVWQEMEEDLPAVHLTFTMIKQRSPTRIFHMVRKVKREWSPLFVELLSIARSKGLEGTDRIFGANPRELGATLMRTTHRILGHVRTATELRHTAAQRLVDAGATEEELAAFMGHSHLDTGLVYFRCSASQAERVNRALGISSIYQRVAKVAHDRFISDEELRSLKGDQQIGGIPHGIPITGIGGCSSGQPACPYNPVLSCYGCRKFMPVRSQAIHSQVLSNFRSVVKAFEQSSRGESSSPAFMQLSRTLDAIETVIEELESPRNES